VTVVPDRPLVSIITACFNAERTLEAALESVRRQTYPHIEQIVIDGGSRDGTPGIIAAHSDRLAYWVSEPDRGIADAWNKGLARARGSIVATLNADDVYHPEAVAEAVRALVPAGRAVSYGTTRYFDDSPGKVVAESALAFDPGALEYGFGFMHTTCFVPRAVYDEVGGFDTRYRIAIDTDFLLRCHFRGIPFVRAGNVTFMRRGGLSDRRRSEAYMEFLAQLREHGHPRLKILRAGLSHWKNRALGAFRGAER
jgi:glycosyltransferase involved in cell wall biosynthesis